MPAPLMIAVPLLQIIGSAVGSALGTKVAYKLGEIDGRLTKARRDNPPVKPVRTAAGGVAGSTSTSDKKRDSDEPGTTGGSSHDPWSGGWDGGSHTGIGSTPWS